MTFRRAFFTVGGLTMLSRITGFVRDVLAANYMGAGVLADVFFIALRLPNLFRRLFAEGAFTISFVPLFTGALKEDREEARKFAEQALAVLLSALIPFTVLMMFFMPWLMHLITPGFADEPEKFRLAVVLSIIMFPYLLLISVAALFGSVLNGMGRFAPYAAAPIAFNAMQILAMLFALSWFPTVAHALAWAVTASGVVQLLWLVIAARRAGMRLGLMWPRLTPRIKRLLVLIGPGALAAGVMQINIFIDMVLASLLPTGSVSYLSYADRLYQLPIGVIGVAIGTALLPLLSHTLRSEGKDKALSDQNRALEFGLYLGLPCAVALALAAEPILAVLFERGQFTADITKATALALSAYALSIPAYMASKVFLTAYYAREDTRTPFRISLITVAVNSAVGFVAVQAALRTGHAESGYILLALNTAFTSWLNMSLLAAGLVKRGMLRPDAKLWRTLSRIGLCAGLMGVLLWAGAVLLAPYFRGHLLVELVALGGLLGVSGSLYLLLAHFTGAQRLDEVFKLLQRKRGVPPLPDASE